MSMNEKPSRPNPSSLLERASEIYGLRQAIRGDAPVERRRETQGGGPQAQPGPVAEVATPVASVPIAAVPAPVPKPSEGNPSTAFVPTRHNTQVKVNRSALRENGMIVPAAPPSALSEEFRLIKRHLLLNAFGGRNSDPLEKGKLILMCSAQPNEGKTYCTVNLALSMASETDIEVLLVDADVAKPEILSTLGIPGGPGLMDALADPSIDAESLIIDTDIPALKILPAGRQSNNDTELLASDRTPIIIDRLAAQNPRRIIIFDSAPALAASPASVLALHVGQVVLVVRADQTSEGELREALTMLEGNARVQMLLNGVTFAGTNRKFGNYYGFGDKS
jgi:protein-tyrosine kinase